MYETKQINAKDINFLNIVDKLDNNKIIESFQGKSKKSARQDFIKNTKLEKPLSLVEAELGK